MTEYFRRALPLKLTQRELVAQPMSRDMDSSPRCATAWVRVPRVPNTIWERGNRAAEALSYNALVQSWPEISSLARNGGKPRADQASLLKEDE